ncbi:MAG TPA: hypothetical protein PLN42_10160, partial [Anaerolineae bacterium]|nr:hypothetical protein [Anaerolineae bacterium]
STFPIALSYARTWHDDSYLRHIASQYSCCGTELQQGGVFFEFATPCTDGHRYTSMIDVYPSGTVRVETYVASCTEPSTGLPLEFESAKLSSNEALAGAEAAGGASYRQEHKKCLLVIVGKGARDDTMLWSVAYRQTPGPADIEYQVNAHTGEVLPLFVRTSDQQDRDTTGAMRWPTWISCTRLAWVGLLLILVGVVCLARRRPK